MRKAALVPALLLCSLFAFSGCNKRPLATTQAPESDAPSSLSSWVHYDSLISEIRSSQPGDKRTHLISQAQSLLDDTASIIPLYFAQNTGAVQNGVSGIGFTPSGLSILRTARKKDSTTLSATLGIDPMELDPALASGGYSHHLLLHEGLCRFSKEGNPEHGLAEKIDISPDGLTITATLRPNAKWADGTSVRPQDFAYAWNRVVNPKTGAIYGFLLDSFARKANGELDIAIKDEHTFSFKLKWPNPAIMEILALPIASPVRQDIVEPAAAKNNSPSTWCREAGFVTTGAYTLTLWQHGRFMRAEKNPYYWDKENVALSQIDLVLSNDPISTWAGFESGNIDYLRNCQGDQIDQAITTGRSLQTQTPNLTYLCFCLNSPLFTSNTPHKALAIRKAVRLVIDRPFIASTIAPRGSIPTATPLPLATGEAISQEPTPAGRQTKQSSFLPSIKPNLEAAQTVLASAGFTLNKDGKLSKQNPVHIRILSRTDPTSISIATLVREDLARLGITSTIDSTEIIEYYHLLNTGSFDLAVATLAPDYTDPIAVLEQWQTSSPNNFPQLGK